jgi:hypothetical protein
VELRKFPLEDAKHVSVTVTRIASVGWKQPDRRSKGRTTNGHEWTRRMKAASQRWSLSNGRLRNRSPKHPRSWNSWEAIRKCFGRRVWLAENSVPAAAGVWRSLQRPESRLVRPWPHCFRFNRHGRKGNRSDNWSWTESSAKLSTDYELARWRDSQF